MIRRVAFICLFALGAYFGHSSPLGEQMFANTANGFVDGFSGLFAGIKQGAVNDNVNLLLDSIINMVPTGSPLYDSLVQLKTASIALENASLEEKSMVAAAMKQVSTQNFSVLFSHEILKLGDSCINY